MPVKHDIRETILHKLPVPIYYKYMCLFWISILFGMIWDLPFIDVEGMDIYE